MSYLEYYIYYNYNNLTDNTMSERKMAKGQTMIYKTLHRKLKIE